MDIERERGISITSAALEFDLFDRHVTLLDTPGHKDFSEDTYRTLLAVDSVVMVIDAAKGIESQTRKLFEVARQRHLPMLTFVNKLDLPARDPLELLDEIERVLGVAAVPMNWPIGTGDRFRGVYDLQQQRVLFYERATGGERRAPVAVVERRRPQARGSHRRGAPHRAARRRAPAAGGRDALRSRRVPRRPADRRSSSARRSRTSASSRSWPRSSTLAPPPSLRESEDGSGRSGCRPTSAGSSSRSRRT